MPVGAGELNVGLLNDILMRVIFAATTFFLFVAPSVWAGIHIKPIFEVRSNELIAIGSAWRSDCPKRIKVTLSVDEDTPSKDISVRAYFYDSDHNRLAVQRSYALVWMSTPKGYSGVGLPDLVPKNRGVDVFFPITPELDKVWKSVVIIASDSKEAVARSRPASAITEIDFPGKDSVKIIDQ